MFSLFPFEILVNDQFSAESRSSTATPTRPPRATTRHMIVPHMDESLS